MLIEIDPVAHNIEDAARSAASFEATDTDLRILMKEFKWVLRDRKVNSNRGLCAAYEALSVVSLIYYAFESLSHPYNAFLQDGWYLGRLYPKT